jgi:murein DD-endopeptidase MepM/ murein hydrolase activator NlpD
LLKSGTGKGVSLAFFLILQCLPVCKAQDLGNSYSFPVIVLLDSKDTAFKQYFSDVENNRKRLVGGRYQSEEHAENLTIYQYTPRSGDDFLSLAARCNIPYCALASLNRIRSPLLMETEKPLLLPSCPGIFIPANVESDMEKLLKASRLGNQKSVEIKIRLAVKTETFYFFPGADFSPTERTFFLNSGFRFPLQNYRMTSNFGVRQSPITGNITMHQGVDLAAPEGTLVFAAADGIVTEIGNNPVYGIYIIITHGERLTSLYGHLQKVETVLRATVKSGSLIGRVGSTGQSTGAHLHFELRQNGKALDPAGKLRP